MPTKTSKPTPEDASARSGQTADAVEQRVLALAEQMGRVIGAVQAKAEGWLEQQSLRDQLVRIREGAGEVLKHLAAGHAAGRKEASRPPHAKTRQSAPNADPAHAPGKKHRAPAPTTHGLKHSDQRLAKIRGAKLIRRPQRQG